MMGGSWRVGGRGESGGRWGCKEGGGRRRRGEGRTRGPDEREQALLLPGGRHDELLNIGVPADVLEGEEGGQVVRGRRRRDVDERAVRHLPAEGDTVLAVLGQQQELVRLSARPENLGAVGDRLLADFEGLLDGAPVEERVVEGRRELARRHVLQLRFAPHRHHVRHARPHEGLAAAHGVALRAREARAKARGEGRESRQRRSVGGRCGWTQGIGWAGPVGGGHGGSGTCAPPR